MDCGDAHYDTETARLCQVKNWCSIIRVINFDKISLVMIHNPLNLISSVNNFERIPVYYLLVVHICSLTFITLRLC